MKGTVPMKRLAFIPLVFIPLTALTCAGTRHASDGAGGSGGSGSGGESMSSSHSSSSPSSSSTGGMGPCTVAADCAGMNDACNEGTCINGVCQKTPANDLGACDDGMFCTDYDSCMNGVCVGGSPKICMASDSCHIPTCDEAGKKCADMPGNDGAQCNPPDKCFQNGVCAAGSCMNGTPVDCSFLDDACGVGVCDAVNGCVKMAVQDGTACDDGLFCTIGDSCTAGVCGGLPNQCAPPGAPCQVGVCDEASQTCQPGIAADGTACMSGNTCVTSETCLGGNCQGGVPANNGKQCADGNGCDVGTTCTNGVCGNPTMVINQCLAADQCCPAGCTPVTDPDCGPIFIGSYTLGMGPVWNTNPPTYSCKEACAVVFGGNALQYSCSTSQAVCDHMAWVDGWGDSSHCQGGAPVAETYKLSATYDCGNFSCSFSAYVTDHCPSTTNYCWK